MSISGAGNLCAERTRPQAFTGPVCLDALLRGGFSLLPVDKAGSRMLRRIRFDLTQRLGGGSNVIEATRFAGVEKGAAEYARVTVNVLRPELGGDTCAVHAAYTHGIRCMSVDGTKVEVR